MPEIIRENNIPRELMDRLNRNGKRVYISWTWFGQVDRRTDEHSRKFAVFILSISWKHTSYLRQVLLGCSLFKRSKLVCPILYIGSHCSKTECDFTSLIVTDPATRSFGMNCKQPFGWENKRPCSIHSS